MVAADCLILIDSGGTAPVRGQVVADWTSCTPAGSAYSIPLLVDKWGLDIRGDYLRWVYTLGQLPIKGQSLQAGLHLLPGLSFWWMTLIAEKEPLKCPAIFTVFKLRALERLYLSMACRGLMYCGRDRRLHRTLSAWCRALGHPYEWHTTPTVRSTSAGEKSGSLQGREWLPHLAQALLFLLAQCWRRYRPVWAQRTRHSPEAGAGPTIVTYFPNVDLEQTRRGRFWSHYWEDLHSLLDDLPQPVNWVWMYANSPQCTFNEAIVLRDSCNAVGGGQHRYFLLEDFVAPRDIWRAIWLFFALQRAAHSFGSTAAHFHFSDSSLNFFPVLQHDWQTSMSGRVAMENCLLAAAFDHLASRLPARPWGLYLWEGQPWELALLTAWRRRGEGPIIGYQHSALGRLKLRSFVDPRSYSDSAPNALPLPSLLAVNGQGARSMLEEMGFPPERLTLVEALRYNDLVRVSPPAALTIRRLLVIAGYRAGETAIQLDLLNQAADVGGLDGYEVVWIKPHPFRSIESIVAAVPPRFRWQITQTPLYQLWAHVERVLTANSTAAVVEAIYAHRPVAVCAAGDEMNVNVFYNDNRVFMIHTYQELIDFLRFGKAADVPADYFLLDPALPRWRKILSGPQLASPPMAQ